MGWHRRHRQTIPPNIQIQSDGKISLFDISPVYGNTILRSGLVTKEASEQQFILQLIRSWSGEHTIKLGEVVDEMRVKDLLLEQILLVEKKYDRRVLEPRICDNRSEQRLRLFHTVLR